MGDVVRRRDALDAELQRIEPFAQTQVMDLMSEAEGVLFLLRRTALFPPTASLDQATPTQYEEARQIWALLGGLPLALDQQYEHHLNNFKVPAFPLLIELNPFCLYFRVFIVRFCALRYTHS